MRKNKAGEKDSTETAWDQDQKFRIMEESWRAREQKQEQGAGSREQGQEACTEAGKLVCVADHWDTGTRSNLFVGPRGGKEGKEAGQGRAGQSCRPEIEE